MKVALVYDRVNKIGGAEKVLLALHQIWPQAPLFTAVYQSKTARWAKVFPVYPSFLNNFPPARNHHEWFAWAAPYAFESFTFDAYDIVISITSAEAKGIITKPKTLHICYLLTPTRYLWSHTHLYLNQPNATTKNLLTKKITPIFLSRLRQWDWVAAQRPDHLVAISKTVALRAQKYYRRNIDAIIYPPVEDLSAQPTETVFDLPSKYFLIVSRLVPYKRIDLVIQAFRQLNENLLIVGEGSYKQQLKKISPPNVKFLGQVSQPKLVAYYRQCQALIFPSEEDFGIVSVEAQSLGKPVIAFASGGGAETVIPGKTGVHFRTHSIKSIIRAIKRFNKQKFHPQTIKANARKYSTATFTQSLINFVETSWQNHQSKFQ